jgi:hypothetical protein
MARIVIAKISSVSAGICALSIAFALPSQAQEPDVDGRLTAPLDAKVESATVRLPSREKFRWKFGLGGESFANEKDQAQTVGVGLEGDLKLSPLKQIEVRARAAARLQSGYAQTRFGDNTPTSGLNLKEAYIQFKPVSFLSLQGGALDQGQLKSPLLVSSRAFPGVAEAISIGDQALGAELRAQQTVPTSTTLSTRAVDTEPTPSFTSETLSLKARPLDNFSLKAFGTHYAFRSLPSTVATDSDLLGNTVTEVGPNSSRFRFEFDGYLVGGEAKARLTRGLVAGIDGQMLRNMQAPETYRNAQMAGAELQIGLPGDIDLKPRGEIFFAESDVAPAFYNSSELGHTNRQGWAADVSMTFKQEKFRLSARYVNSDMINSNLIQSRQAFVLIKFETLYDVL